MSIDAPMPDATTPDKISMVYSTVEFLTIIIPHLDEQDPVHTHSRDLLC
jgi:hypothetical protein